MISGYGQAKQGIISHFILDLLLSFHDDADRSKFIEV